MSRRVYVEQSRSGNPQFVRPVRRNSTRMSTHDRLRDAEAQIAILVDENDYLHRQVSTAQAAEHRAETRYRSLVNEHSQCRDLRDQLRTQSHEITRLKNRLDDEKEKNDGFKAEIRRLTGAGNYRQRYEDKLREVAILQSRIDQGDDLIQRRDAEILQLNNLLREEKHRVTRRDSTIENMRQVLRGLGYSYREERSYWSYVMRRQRTFKQLGPVRNLGPPTPQLLLRRKDITSFRNLRDLQRRILRFHLIYKMRSMTQIPGLVWKIFSNLRYLTNTVNQIFCSMFSLGLSNGLSLLHLNR